MLIFLFIFVYYYFVVPPICNISLTSTIFSRGFPLVIPLSTSTLSIFVQPFQSTIMASKQKVSKFFPHLKINKLINTLII